MITPPAILKTLMSEEVKPLVLEKLDLETSSRETRMRAIEELSKSINYHQIRIESLNVQIRILGTLVRGKLKDRLLVALKYAGPLYKTLCPRRYRELPGYCNPRHILILGVCAGICVQEHARHLGVELDKLTVGEMRKLLERSPEGVNYETDEMNKRSWRMIGDLIDNAVPTYYLDHETCEAVLATDCDDLKVLWEDFEWPHSSFMWIPPVGIFPNSPLLVVAHRDDRYVTFTGLTDKVVDHNNHFFFFELPLSESIGGGLDTMKKVIERRISVMAEGTSADSLREFMVNVYTLCANALLAMVAEPEFEEEVKPGHKSDASFISEHKPRDPMAMWNPTFFRLSKHSQGGDSERVGVGLGSHRRAHPRRAHWQSVWLAGDEDAQLEVGKRARCITDQRVAMWVVSISPDVVVLRSSSGVESPHHPSEVKPARLKLRWIKRKIVGLKSHVVAS